MEALVESDDDAPSRTEFTLSQYIFFLIGIMVLTAGVVITGLIWRYNSDEWRNILINDYHLAAGEWSSEVVAEVSITYEKVSNFLNSQILAEMRPGDLELQSRYSGIIQVVEDTLYVSGHAIQSLQILEDRYGNDTTRSRVDELVAAGQEIEAFVLSQIPLTTDGIGAVLSMSTPFWQQGWKSETKILLLLRSCQGSQ